MEEMSQDPDSGLVSTVEATLETVPVSCFTKMKDRSIFQIVVKIK